MVIGPGMDTPNKTKNRKCVEWDGSVVHPPLFKHLHLDDPHRKMILTHVVCGSSYIMYSLCVNACCELLTYCVHQSVHRMCRILF